MARINVYHGDFTPEAWPGVSARIVAGAYRALSWNVIAHADGRFTMEHPKGLVGLTVSDDECTSYIPRPKGSLA